MRYQKVPLRSCQSLELFIYFWKVLNLFKILHEKCPLCAHSYRYVPLSIVNKTKGWALAQNAAFAFYIKALKLVEFN